MHIWVIESKWKNKPWKPHWRFEDICAYNTRESARNAIKRYKKSSDLSFRVKKYTSGTPKGKNGKLVGWWW